MTQKFKGVPLNDLADLLEPLRATLSASRLYVATCADDELPNAAADLLTKIDQLLAK